MSSASRRFRERLITAAIWGGAAFMPLVLIAIVLALMVSSRSTWAARGAAFIVSTDWNPVTASFGALPFIGGTIVSSALALVLATPVALGAAIYLSELCPEWLRAPLALLVELLAAVPSVIYGLCGFYVLRPLMVHQVEPALSRTLGWFPLFRGAAFGNDTLIASLVLSIMVLPTISSVSREVLRAVPDGLREGGFALGATRWAVIRTILLPAARSGLVGAVMLGLGRALGEAMAVTMLIGNEPRFTISLLEPSSTMASVVANQYGEAQGAQLSALSAIALLLFVLTFAFNTAARWVMAPRSVQS